MGYPTYNEDKEFLSHVSRWHLKGKRKELIKKLFWVVVLFVLFYGLLQYESRWGEIDILTNEFSYPMQSQEFGNAVQELRKMSSLGQTSKYKILNPTYANIPFLHTGVDEQDYGPYGILIIVKSAINNADKRAAIRSTWGNYFYLNATQLSPTLPTKIMFICGVSEEDSIKNIEKSENIAAKQFSKEWMHNDIIIADFVDSYANNTYKSVLALRWAALEFKADFNYMLLVDDDMYIDLENLQSYLTRFPKQKFISNDDDDQTKKFQKYQFSTIFNKNQSTKVGKEILQDGLYLGAVYVKVKPNRAKLDPFSSKRNWPASLIDYPFNYYPPYIPGSSIVFSKESVFKMYYGSLLTRHFWIDDVYLGIVAHKLKIIPVDNPHFHSEYPRYDLQVEYNELAEAISFHGFRCPAQMIDLWINRNPKKLNQCNQ